MSDIRQWLEQMGFGKYADAFEREEVDLDALPHLTSEILKDIGVPAGPRAKLLVAIQALKQEDPAATTSDTIEPAAPTEAQVTVREAERRQITVMFCDLVGSTEFAAKLDPEDLRALMQAYQQATGAVVERYEGHVAQYLGDGIMTYFGWPKAHEDDAERAVRAGLGIVGAVKAVEAPQPLQVRIGIATGSVVVGETGAGDASVPKLAVGETPNLAARLQGLAGPNEIAIAPSTHRLVAGAFEYDDLGQHELKGIVEPVRAWRVTGLGRAEGRFEAAHAGGLTPLVGREAEIAMLMERWSQARDGEGQVVLLSGEPGIGKSRIIQVLRERVAETNHIRLRYQCSPYYTNSAFYPLIDQLGRAAGFERDESPEARLDKLEALLGQSSDAVADVAPLIAAMLSLPLDRYPQLDLSLQKQKEITIAVLAEQVAGLAKRQPVLLLFEDAHWCDPTTLEVLAAIIERIEDTPVLTVITHRPEFDPPWTAHGHMTTLTLNRLSRRQGADIVAKVTGGKALPKEVMDQIVAKTDGVPLFVEELTKTVLEAGFLKDAGNNYELDGPLPPLAIPSTLQDSLMARLDRLASVKEVAQIGACIGREFSYELLSAVSPLGDDALRDALAELVGSELIFGRGAPPDAVYTFKHALIQDTAYESLLKSRRHVLHRAIARSLEEKFPEVGEHEPEFLAHHYTAAGTADVASSWWLKAGRRAAQRSANLEAVAHLRKALTSVSAMRESLEARQLELDIQMALGGPLIAVDGPTAPAAVKAYSRAHELCELLGNPPQFLQVMHWLTTVHCIRGSFNEAREMAEQYLGRAEDLKEEAALLNAYRASAIIRFSLGEFEPARYFADRAVDLYDAAMRADRSRAIGYGQDAGVAGLAVLGWTLWGLGYPDQALGALDRARALADELAHPHSQAYALFYAAFLHMNRGEVSLANDAAESAIALSHEHGFGHWLGMSKIVLGVTNAIQGAPAQGITEIREGVAGYQKTKNRMGLPVYYLCLARALISAGQLADAHGVLQEAESISAATGERQADSELHRLRGELVLAGTTGDSAKADIEFAKAVDVARKQKAKSLELRAATSLARLWQSQGKYQKARDLLFPVYDWFTEGLDTKDLKDANALLEELK